MRGYDLFGWMRVTLVALATLALLVSAPMNVIAHGPAALASAAGDTGHADDHGHSHDDAVDDAERPNHSHGHNAGDHGHDPSPQVAVRILDRTIAPTLVALPARDALRRSPIFRLDRPPRA